MNKINLEKVIAVIATVLVVAFLLEPVGHLVRMFVLDMEFALAKDSAPAVSEPFVPELDKNLTQVSLQGVVGVAEEMEEAQEETQSQYPDAAPEEVYSPTHLGARPYYIYFLTHEEKVMMAKVVYREARGECERGRVAVAAVIINRYLNGGFGGSISEVVRQTNAFANISYVTDDMLEANPQCMEAVELACKGWDPTREWFEDTGALFFYNPNGDLSPEARAAREGVEQYSIGNHNFHVELN
jgi:spore germination cell wall hydrolase CwlJ-like protein